MDFCICDDISDVIWITDKMLLHFKLSKSGQILCVDKTCFPRPGHIYLFMTYYNLLVMLLLQDSTPLERAYNHGHCQVIEFLCSSGAKVNAYSKVRV